MEPRTDHRARQFRHFADQDGNRDHDAGIGESDQWRFTPSILDTNSFAFTSFANQQSEGFTTPTGGGGMGGVFHNQAGDLHTPGMGFGLGTPLSISNSEGHHHSAPASDMHGFHPHLLHSQPYSNPTFFAQQQSYAPSSFVHQDSGYETTHGRQNGLPGGDLTESRKRSNFTGFPAGSYNNMPAPPMQSVEK
jgi:hypothetical protein